MLENFVIIVHLLAAVAIVALILLQHGKGADMGASFGAGASQTVFGVQGSGNLLTHATAIGTAIFFVTSLSLGYMAKQKTSVNADEAVIETVQQQPANDEVPADTTKKDDASAAVQTTAESDAKEAPSQQSEVPAPANNSTSSSAGASSDEANTTKGEEIPE